MAARTQQPALREKADCTRSHFPNFLYSALKTLSALLNSLEQLWRQRILRVKLPAVRLNKSQQLTTNLKQTARQPLDLRRLVQACHLNASRSACSQRCLHCRRTAKPRLAPLALQVRFVATSSATHRAVFTPVRVTACTRAVRDLAKDRNLNRPTFRLAEKARVVRRASNLQELLHVCLIADCKLFRREARRLSHSVQLHTKHNCVPAKAPPYIEQLSAHVQCLFIT